MIRVIAKKVIEHLDKVLSRREDECNIPRYLLEFILFTVF